MILESVITCPHCGTAKAEAMPTDACRFFYTCTECGVTLKPRPGDCCVFCSYGSGAVSADSGGARGRNRRGVMLHAVTRPWPATPVEAHASAFPVRGKERDAARTHISCGGSSFASEDGR